MMRVGVEEAKADGKVRAVGLSFHNPDIAVKAICTGRFATLPFPFNFIEDDPQEKVFPAAREWGVGLIAKGAIGRRSPFPVADSPETPPPRSGFGDLYSLWKSILLDIKN